MIKSLYFSLIIFLITTSWPCPAYSSGYHSCTFFAKVIAIDSATPKNSQSIPLEITLIGYSLYAHGDYSADGAQKGATVCGIPVGSTKRVTADFKPPVQADSIVVGDLLVLTGSGMGALAEGGDIGVAFDRCSVSGVIRTEGSPRPNQSSHGTLPRP